MVKLRSELAILNFTEQILMTVADLLTLPLQPGVSQYRGTIYSPPTLSRILLEACPRVCMQTRYLDTTNC